MKIGSLFTGYGGLDMAASARLDAQVVWVSDNDKAAARVLAARYDVPNLGDVSRIEWDEVEPVDVLTGGTPCQDLSHAGKRAGFRPGTRSNLWLVMCDAIAILRPKIVVWENVRGVLSARADSDVEFCPGCVGITPKGALRAFGRVVGDLDTLGYDAQWCSVRASDVGAPHERIRIFLVAHPNRPGRRQYGWPVPAPTENAPAQYASIASDGLALLPTPVANDIGRDKTLAWWDEWAPRQKAADGTPAPHGKSLAIEAQRLLPTPNASDTSKHAGQHESKRAGHQLRLTDATEANPDRWGAYGRAIEQWANLTRPAPHPTEIGTKGQPVLSPRFVEWLMGLPDGWVTDVDGITRNQALKMLGNGVVPQQAAHALDQLGWYP